MKKSWLTLCLLLGIIVTPFAVLAQDVAPGDAPMAVEPIIHDPDVIAVSQQVFTGVTSGNWWLAASAVLVLVTFAVRKYGSKFFPKLKPYLDNPLIAFALPVVMASLTGIVNALTSGADIKVAAMTGLKIAMGAVWMYVGKVKIDEVRESAKQKAAEQVTTTADAVAVHTNKGPNP